MKASQIKKSFKKAKRVQQKGSLLIMLLVFATVVALTIASIRTALISGQKQESDRALRLEYKNILTSLKQVVEGQGFCNEPSVGMLDGSVKLTGTNFEKVEGPKELHFSHNGSPITLAKDWKNAKGNLKIVDIRLEHIDTWNIGAGADKWKRESVPAHTFATVNKASLRAQYYLIVEAIICKDPTCSMEKGLGISNKRTFPGNTLSRYAVEIVVNIRFEAQKDVATVRPKPNGKAVSCFGRSTGAAQCEDMGGIWNPFASKARYRCEPHDKCFEKVAQTKEDGTFIKCPEASRFEKILSGYALKPPFTPGGAKYPKYSCVWCNSNKNL